MTTALSLIQDSLEKIGTYSPGETVSDADAERALIVLNDMIDSWSTESLTCFTILEQTTTLIPGKSAYTIGTVGSPDINDTRPIRLRAGPGAAYLQDSNGNSYGVEVVSKMKWNMIGNRSPTTTSNIPDTLYYSTDFPLGTLNFFPTPNQGIAAFWDSFLQLTEFANLAADVTFPPGYQLAIKDNMAIMLCPYFKPDGFQIPQLWFEMANKSKANIKRANTRQDSIVFDGELLPRASATYNIYRDSY